MNDKFFIDTDIFVYTFDKSSPEKRASAMEIVQTALDTGHGIISYQVAQEFINVASKKFVKPLRTRDQLEYLDRVLSPLLEIFPSIDLYRKGVILSDRYGYSFYDSLIIAAALTGGCKTLYSEDLQHGQKIEGILIQNPFGM